jgi:ribosomal protein S14
MLSLKVKNIVRQKKFKTQEILRLKLKFLFTFFLQNQKSNKLNHKRLVFLFLTQHRIKNYLKTRINRRCIVNNRSKISSRRFSVSRVLFRETLQLGFIPGFRKAVW